MRIASLNPPLSTVDLARRPDGCGRIMALGDGRVSDRPAGVAPEDLITLLRRR
jgi:hypothetical protein